MLTQVGYAPLFLFIAITLTTVFLFLRTIKYPNFKIPRKTAKTVMIILFIWIALQGWLGFRGGYRDYVFTPPKIFILGVAPAFLFILCLLLVSKGRTFLKQLDLKALTVLHLIRIPVELGLFFLCAHKVLPTEMTFTGQNFDILSGLTAPLIVWLVFVKKRKNAKAVLIIWNFICLALLANIVYTAIFSTPYPFQKFGMEQPNIAVFYFPYVWLPTVIVPLVVLAHISTFLKLFSKNNEFSKAE